MRISEAEAIKRGWMPAAPKKVTLSPVATRRSRGTTREKEGEEQAQVIAEFRAQYPQDGFLLIHIPNGGSRKNRFEGWRLKQQGVRAGVSDLLLPQARGGFFGLWIEFKAAPPFDAEVSQAQEEWLAEMRRQGYQAQLCKGVDAALAVLRAYMKLPLTHLPK